MNLLASLDVSAGALTAYDQVLAVVQNNVANSSTPGYAQQTQDLEAMPFDPSDGTMGGVQAGAVVSSRDQYAEQAVRSQTVLLGQAQQNVNSLTSLQSVFDITGQSGISAALNNLYSSFSAWAQTPTDSSAQQSVLTSASAVAQAFQQTASNLDTVAQQTTGQIQDLRLPRSTNWWGSSRATTSCFSTARPTMRVSTRRSIPPSSSSRNTSISAPSSSPTAPTRY